MSRVIDLATMPYGMAVAFSYWRHSIAGELSMRIQAPSKILIVAAMLGLEGCPLPQTTRTAVLHDVKIQEGLSSDSLQVQPGDEVRWINLRKQAVRIDVPNLSSNQLSCQQGFRNWMGRVAGSPKLNPGETVSLCFKTSTVVNYHVRATTALAGGMQVLPGVIEIGQPQQP
jgi:plastocyanin